MIRCGYGTYLPATPTSPAELREEIARAEDAGFDAIFFSEHHGVAGYVPDPLALAVYALARTTRMRAGTLPLVLSLRHPALVAETAALASFLSGGRMILGVGAGYVRQDFEAVGIPVERPGRRFAAAVDLVRRAWRGQVDEQGEFYAMRQDGPPLHRGESDPPLWIASSSPIGMRRAARLGDGIMLNSMLSGDEVRALTDEYRRACALRGVAPGTVGAIRRGWFGGRAESEEFLHTFVGQLESAVNFVEYARKPWVRARASRGFVNDVVFTGEPDALAESLQAWCGRAGVDYVMLKLHWGSRDFGAITEQLGHSRRFFRALGA